ncbi:CPBP family intramembrane metalloprotease domain-containing protein, partial [Achromobacter sp. LC458]
MPLYSPWPALFFAALMLWPPATRRWALLPLAVAWAWAWKDGVIEPV